MSIWASFRRSRLFACTLFVPLAALLPALPATGQAASPPILHVMPLPRSVQMGSGALVLGGQFHAVFAGNHDARVDAALDRFLWRLDRQCGEIRRAQHDAAPDAPATLTLHVAGPGAPVQGVDEDESYKLAVTSASADLTAATDV